MPADDNLQNKQLSLCIPFLADAALVPEFVNDVTSFFAKFPISYEVLLAAPRSNPLPPLPANFRVIECPKTSARAQNLVTLFTEAKGDHLITMDLELAIPLSECFKILQVFFAEESTEVVFGDRTQKKKKLEDTLYRTNLSRTETFFHGIMREKADWAFRDPFCPVFALRKSVIEKLRPHIKARGWHLTPEIQRLARELNLQTQEIPLYAGSRRSQAKTPAITEILGLLNFVLFRI